MVKLVPSHSKNAAEKNIPEICLIDLLIVLQRSVHREGPLIIGLAIKFTIP